MLEKKAAQSSHEQPANHNVVQPEPLQNLPGSDSHSLPPWNTQAQSTWSDEDTDHETSSDQINASQYLLDGDYNHLDEWDSLLGGARPTNVTSIINQIMSEVDPAHSDGDAMDEDDSDSSDS